MGYNSNVNLYLENRASQSMQIWTSFRCGSDPVQTWPASGSPAPFVRPHQVAGPMVVGFNTGVLFTGHDYWMFIVKPRNAPAPLTTGWFQCALGSADNGKKEMCVVSSSAVAIVTSTHRCSAPLGPKDATIARGGEESSATV